MSGYVLNCTNAREQRGIVWPWLPQVEPVNSAEEHLDNFNGKIISLNPIGTTLTEFLFLQDACVTDLKKKERKKKSFLMMI